MLQLAGIPIPNELVHEIASRLRDIGDNSDLDAAEKLEHALAHDRRIVALSLDDREAILAALDDPPDELTEFRGVLLSEHVWRMREGL